MFYRYSSGMIMSTLGQFCTLLRETVSLFSTVSYYNNSIEQCLALDDEHQSDQYIFSLIHNSI